MKTTTKQELRKPLALSLLLTLIYVFSNVNYPLIIQSILDNLGSNSFSQLKGKFCVLLGMLILVILSCCAMGLSKTAYLNKAKAFYRENILRGMFSIRREALSSQEEAQLLSVFNNDISMVVADYHETLLEAVSSLMTIFFAFSAIVSIHPLMALLICCQMLLITTVPRFFRKKLQRQKDMISSTLQIYNVKLKDCLFCLPVLKSYLAEQELLRRTNAAGLEANEAVYSHKKTATWADLASMFLGYGGDFLIYLTGAILISGGNMTIGGLMAVIQITNVLAHPISTIAYNWNTMQAIRPLRRKLLDMMRCEEGNPITYEETRSIELKEVSVEKNKSLLLHDINLTLEQGKKYLLVGPNGCGKSTLLKVLNRSIIENEGQLLVNGKPNKSYLADCAMVYQDASLFTASVKENITLCQPYDEELLKKLVSFLGIKELLAETEETVIHRFSGGEKQKIALCRALLRKPKVLLLDEAFSAMDSASRSHLEDELLNGDCTLVNIAHSFRKEAVERYDAVLLMQDGRLVETAPYEKLSEKGKSHIPLE